MVAPELLQSLGVFVQREFLDADARQSLRREMLDAPAEAATVVHEGKSAVVETTRRVLIAQMEAAGVEAMRKRLLALAPALSQHFQTPVTECERPTFLVYGPGAHYKPHHDTGEWLSPALRRRRISVVLFLNGASPDVADDTFDGGALTFYGLVEGAHWENVGLPLHAEPGMLVAFRPEILHEVTPVTRGQRLTVVTWFLGDAR